MGGQRRSKVGEAFVLILQIGLAMMVAVGMMVALAVFLNSKFNTIWFMPPLLVLGFAGGVRAAWNLVQGFLKSDGTGERRAHDRLMELQAERMKHSADATHSSTDTHDADDTASSEGNSVEVYHRK